MKKTEQDNRQDMLEAFYNIFAALDPDTPEDVEAIIRAAGVDPDEYAAKIRKLAQDALKEQAKEQINTARQRYNQIKSMTIEGRQSIIQKIQEKLAKLDSQKRAAFAHHRNLESASDADLQSLLDDLSYLTDSSE